MNAGVAVIDITPPPGLLMSGFAARTEPSIGTHDPLTVRALVVGDTALVTVDVVGLHEEMVARIRARTELPDANVVVAAIHTHGAPISQIGRLGDAPDPAFLQAIEDGCVAAITEARANARPATITAGMGDDPDVARNRRHADGLLDRSVPVLRFRDAAGQVFAVLVSYACHPVVLGADNRLLTADYVHYVRDEIEAAHPGAVAVFATGCCGDVNTGHSAHASWTLAANAARSFETAERLGRRIGKAALAAGEAPVGEGLAALSADVVLRLTRLEEQPLPVLAGAWRAEREGADPVRRTVLDAWIGWAEKYSNALAGNWTGRVCVFDWGGVPIVALPGEIFAETGLLIREAIGDRPAFIISCANGTPGYIPPASEFRHGGYEVDEAHRFIGMPGTFAPGSAESLAGAAQALLGVAGLNR
jgi:CRP-like cAMP-binding protein